MIDDHPTDEQIEEMLEALGPEGREVIEHFLDCDLCRESIDLQRPREHYPVAMRPPWRRRDGRF